MNAIKILKNSGCYEDFSQEKIVQSLLKAGISKHKAQQIANVIYKSCKENQSTKSIYKKVLKILNKENRRLATRYSMSKAITELGPDGYHFEAFIKFLFQKMGYLAQTNKHIHGEFVRHEIDVIAKKDKSHIYCECKFHNNQSTKNDLKTALYIYARYLDIKNNKENNITEFWIISNTKFTKDAITYANGVGLTLIGSNTPNKNSLTNMALNLKLFPITCLSSLKKNEAKLFIKNDIILIEQLLDRTDLFFNFNIDVNRQEKIIEEINHLLERE